MLRILIKVIIIFITILQLYGKKRNICPGFGHCKCYNVREELLIQCSRTNHFDKILPSVLHKYSNRTITRISIHKCSKNRELTENIFKNATILEIQFWCPFRIVHPESLVYVKSLTKLRMGNAKFKIIPYGIQYLHNLKVLDMQNGTLTKIENDFENMTFLENLDLSRNKISYIYNDTFRNNRHLYKIDLSYNRIVHLHRNTIRFNLNLKEFLIGHNHLLSARSLLHDTNLKVIDMRENKIRIIDHILGNVSYLESLDLGMNMNLKLTDSSFLTSFTPLLKLLKLDRCLLKELPPNLLKPLTRLEVINLSFNKLTSIPKKFFYGLSCLISVNLKFNKIMHLDSVFKGNSKLQTLFANRNKITKIGGAFKYTKSLQTLDISRNLLEAIDEKDFKRSYFLKNLNLDHNRISNISAKAFASLKKLKFLKLSSNTIYSLNGSLQSMRKLQSLILGHNQLEKIDEFDFKDMNRLKLLDLSSNPIKSAKKAFSGLVNLRKLKINDNNLTTLSRNSFPPNFPFHTLEAAGNEWMCDCRLLWLRDLLAENLVSCTSSIRCFEPLRFYQESLDKMTAKNLITWSESCPQSCQCGCVSEDEEFFVKVDCSGKKLTEVPMLFPNRTRELSLQENHLTKSIAIQIDIYVWLRSVNLEGNRLNHINLGRFGNLNSLLLARNNLTRFFSNPPENITTWTLSDNPWICDCMTLKFRNWLLLHRTKIPDVNETRCSRNVGKQAIANKVIIYLSEEDLCPKKFYFIETAVVPAVVLLLAAICYLIFRCHSFKIKAWCFSRGMTCLKREMNGDSRKKFDAFISAADEDMPFVQNSIIPELEQKAPFYSLFEPRRNLPTEEAWEIEKLMEAVVNSKRIMVILTENYIKNNFFVEFLNGISDHFVERDLHRLIPITLGKFPSSSDFDPTIKTAVEPQRCLRVGQKLFWEMLRYAMPFKNIEDIQDRQSKGSREKLTEQ